MHYFAIRIGIRRPINGRVLRRTDGREEHGGGGPVEDDTHLQEEGEDGPEENEYHVAYGPVDMEEGKKDYKRVH